MAWATLTSGCGMGQIPVAGLEYGPALPAIQCLVAWPTL